MEKYISTLSAPEMAAKTGELNNLVVYIRFADDTEFTTSRQVYDDKFNPESGYTLKSYFKEASYNNILIHSSHYPICDLNTNLSYQDYHNRNYFQPYNATTNPEGYSNSTERRVREHQLLVDAVNSISGEVPAELNIDNDNDGRVDNVCFIIKGNNDAWADLLWAHRWSLYSQDVYINGKRVYDYTFQPESQNSVKTLNHEMFHVLGAPDLYHYTSNGITPVQYWDIMERGGGHMGAYMKWKYSGYQWIENIPEITASGTYTLNPLASPTNNCYKIKSPNSETEFFVVEYRQKTGTFEGTLPGTGLLVYRINPAYQGNASGPPDEVYVYRPNGTTTVNGTINSANFSTDVGRTAINDDTNPSSFLTDGSPGGLDISNVSASGSTISFYYSNSIVPPVADFTASPTTVNQGESVTFTDLSTNNPTSWSWQFEGGTPSTSSQKNPVVVYETAGTYRVSLTVTNNGGSDTETKTAYITVNVVAPVADFQADITSVTENNSISFADLSTNYPTNWVWTFPGGTPGTSTEQNPVITYPTAGYYDVTLTATNSAGSTTETKTDYISVAEPSYCESHGSAILEHIASVSVNGETNSSGASGAAGYEDFSGFSFNVESGTSANLSLSPGFSDRSKNEYWSVWIDFNQDKDFEDAGELVFTALRKRNTVSGTINIPNGLDCTTRMRVSLSRNGIPGPCDIFDNGEVEDYTVVIGPEVVLPLEALFSAFPTTSTVGGTVDFTDESTGNPISWDWTFNGGTPSSSTEQNPSVVYEASGAYSVSLTVGDGTTTDTETRTGYITVEETGVYCIPTDITPSDYIANIEFGSINNPAAGEGYTYDPGIHLFNSGQSYQVTLTPANDRNRNFWRIWIDANGDGDFIDSDEQLLALNNKKGTVTQDITIPSVIVNSTRMRIALRTGSSPAPCDDSFSGQVADYEIAIGAAAPVTYKSGTIKTETMLDKVTSVSDLMIYPNPTGGNLILQLENPEMGDLYTIYNLQSKKMKENQIISDHTKIDVSDFSTGVYLIKVTNGSRYFTKRFIKK
jgi:M6 family metalloprotease-like protein